MKSTTQILYLITYLGNNDFINYEQKINLKKLLLTNPQYFFQLLKELKSSNNIFKFFKGVTKLIPDKNITDNIYESNIIMSNKSNHLITISNDSCNDEITKEEKVF